MIKSRFLIFLSFGILLLVSCSQNASQQKIQLTGQAQGTYYSITYFDDLNRNLQTEIDSLLKNYDMSVSLWEPNSILSRVNRNDTGVILDQIFIKNFELSKKISALSDGYFDFTISPLVQAWGFSFKQGADSLSVHDIDSLKLLVDWQKVEIENGKVVKENPNITIDFNAIAQGFSVDLTSAFLESKGIESYIVDIGGEIFAQGNKPNGKPWIVGIEKPSETKESERIIQHKIKLNNKGLATSGNYRKYIERNGKRFSHSINPKTGYPVEHNLLSVTVLAETAAEADALGTAFMIMGTEKAKLLLTQLQNVEAHFIMSGEDDIFETFSTPGFSSLIID